MSETLPDAAEAAECPPSNGQDASQSPTGKRQRTARTALACMFCRQRKAKCSGHWPACAACVRRKMVCTYPGSVPIALPGLAPDLPEEAPVDLQVWPAKEAGRVRLPPAHLQRKAVSLFRENYSPTFLNFLHPQLLIDEDAADKLPLPLLFCIIALVSRTLTELRSDDELPSMIGDRYAELAQKELASAYEEPSLATIQCCLVLCVYEIGEGSEHRGWLRLGHAVRLAQLLLLHKRDASLGFMDWGDRGTATSPTTAECERRTFWSCFCLERLLANGRDRVAVLASADITTRFPHTDLDFIFGRQRSTCSLRCDIPCTNPDHDCRDSLMTHTIRIVDVLSEVVAWNGRGGRHTQPRAPWLSGMPFSVLDDKLHRWLDSLPTHLSYTPENTSAIHALGKANLWTAMWLVYFQARAYLHREYMPLMPKLGYDPASGPCDGPVLNTEDTTPPDQFWFKSAVAMVESANAISDLYQVMKKRDLAATSYPFPGLGLLVAASVHVVYSIFAWESMESTITPEESLAFLRKDMDAFNDLGQRWSLAIHWTRQISAYYKLNGLTKRSWLSRAEDRAVPANLRAVKDGIMNYVRQMSPTDREARDLNLRATFDFDGWIAALERCITAESEGGSTFSGDPMSPALSEGPQSVGPPTGMLQGFQNLDSLAATAFYGEANWIFDQWEGIAGSGG